MSKIPGMIGNNLMPSKLRSCCNVKVICSSTSVKHGGSWQDGWILIGRDRQGFRHDDQSPSIVMQIHMNDDSTFE